ncbi:hypothetical protein ZOSMA_32G00880, partial [Zostera marina]
MLFRRGSIFFRKFRRISHVATARDDTIVISSATSILSIPVSARSFRFYTTTKKFGTDDYFRMLLLAQTALVFGIGAHPIVADNGSADELVQDNNSKEEPYASGLRRVEDGSIVSNNHTVKWRLFTDNGRTLSLQGKLEDAEKQFILALQEAKEGFGERDPHVASSFNNLAEIYRVKKLFEKAEPLYLDAIQILEESFGPEDVRVGAALHNLGQFYLVQRKLDESKKCYERALKIKGRVLGYASTDYADTMYHLGTVMNLLGNDKDSVALIRDSIRILEEGGLGESMTFIRKMRYLSQILMQSNKPYEVENLQRKILHILEISKGCDAVETIVAAESLALTLQSLGNLVEARELVERCLSLKESILGGDHLQ